LEELQHLVDGYIEAVRGAQPSTIMMIVNEEDLLLAWPESPSCPGNARNVVLGKIEGSEVVGLNDSEVDVLQSGFAAFPIIPSNTL
jgi:hypothetical protein